MSLACRVNATLTQWTTAIQSVAMAALVVDRAIMLRRGENPKSDPRNCVIRFLPALMWLYGTALVAPIAVTSHIVDVRPFPDRYSCWIVPTSEGSEDLLYPLSLLLLGHVLPWITILVITTVIIRHIIYARRRQQKLEEAAIQRSQGIGNSNTLIYPSSYQTSWSDWLGSPGPLSWEEVKFYFLSSILLFLYTILIVPHVLCVNIYSLTAVPALQDSSAPRNSSLTELTPVPTGTYDCVLVWFRYKFTVLIPIVVIAVHKEVRKKCEHMFCCCCCRNNAVVQLENPRSISACVEKREQLSDQGLNIQKMKQASRKINQTKKEKYTRIAHYRTPVLFATSEGLHLRFIDDRLEGSYYINETGADDIGTAGGKEQCWTVEPRFLCQFCDVALIVSTPTKKVSNQILQQIVSRGSRLPVFVEETLAEKDLQVSDDLTGDSSGELSITRGDTQESLVAINERNFSVNIRKATRVRFAQTVSEIPLCESGVWSAPEDQGFAEQSMVYKQNEPQHSVHLLKQKSQVNVPSGPRSESS
ncbi:uncharacterized protein LOC110841345 isoform X2 [Zootermopsis nevadensis]|nr:uncharacterized protein LOC110841345 isoform X2 [Zootermopsis nevadensis]